MGPLAIFPLWFFSLRTHHTLLNWLQLLATTVTMSKPADLPPMQYRYLGRSGLQVSAISLGGWLTYGGHVDKSMFAQPHKEGHHC